MQIGEKSTRGKRVNVRLATREKQISAASNMRSYECLSWRTSGEKFPQELPLEGSKLRRVAGMQQRAVYILHDDRSEVGDRMIVPNIDSESIRSARVSSALIRSKTIFGVGSICKGRRRRTGGEAAATRSYGSHHTTITSG